MRAGEALVLSLRWSKRSTNCRNCTTNGVRRVPWPTNTRRCFGSVSRQSSRINKQHQEHFEALKGEQVRNLELKTELAPPGKLAAQPLTTRKEWEPGQRPSAGDSEDVEDHRFRAQEG